MKHRIWSLLLALAMLLTLLPASAFAVEADSSETVKAETIDGIGSIEDIIELSQLPSSFGLDSTKTTYNTSYYNQLDASSKAIYDAIYSDTSPLKEGPSKEPVSITGVPSANARTDIQAAIAALLFDHPELSWLVNTEYSYVSDGTSIVSFSLTENGYTAATTSPTGEITQENHLQAYTGNRSDIITAISAAQHSIGDLSSASDYEKIKSIYDWVCNNIEYADTASSKFKNNWRSYQTAYSALVEHVTVCAGYAKSFKLLCDAYSIPCVVVTGTSHGVGHAWNYVQLDSNWYAVDCTWADQSTWISYDYLLKGSNDFADHSNGSLYNEFQFAYPTLNTDNYKDPNAPDSISLTFSPTTRDTITIPGGATVPAFSLPNIEDLGIPKSTEIVFTATPMKGNSETNQSIDWSFTAIDGITLTPNGNTATLKISNSALPDYDNNSATVITITAACGTTQQTQDIGIYVPTRTASFVQIFKGNDAISNDNISKGGSTTYTAKVYDQYGQEMSSQTVGQTVSWAVDSASMASVSNGTVTVSDSANNGATFNVTATVAGFSDSVAVTVSEKPLHNLTVTSNTMSLVYGSAGNIAANSTTNGTISYASSNTNIATVDNNGKVTATGKGNAQITITASGGNTYADNTATCTVTVTEKSLTDDMVTLSTSSFPYNGTEQVSNVIVKDGSKPLTEATDFTVRYTNNINVGTATATITGTGNYTGTVTKTFTITAASIANANLSITGDSHTYTGEALTPQITVNLNSRPLAKDTDYTVSYRNNTNVGTATVTITGRGNYSGTATATFTISPAPINGATVAVADGPYTYTGKEVTPSVTVTQGSATLVKDRDYTVTYADNINVGTATVTITGRGNYTGEAAANFNINKGALSYTIPCYLKNETNAELTIDLSEPLPKAETFTYSKAVDQVELTGCSAALDGHTLTLSAKGGAAENTKETYKVTATSANYNAEVTIVITYTSKDVEEITVPTVADVTYTGKPAQVYTGAPTIEGQDTAEFTITYEGTGETAYSANEIAPTNAGTYSVTFALKGENDFVANDVRREFTISPAIATVTAKPMTLTQGDRLPTEPTESDYTITGLLENDSLTPLPESFSFSVSNTDTATDSATVVLVGPAFSADGNYAIQYVSGKLTITAASPVDPGTGGNAGGSTGGGTGGSTGGSSQPTTPTNPTTPPSGGSTTTVTPSATVSNGTASAQVSSGQMTTAISQAKDQGSDTVVIAPQISGSPERSEVTLPAGSVGQLGSQTSADLTVKTPAADVTLPNGSLDALANAGGSVVIATERSGDTIDFTLTAGGAKVDRVQGGVKVSVPAADAAPGTVAVLVKDDGTREIIRKSAAVDGSLTIPLDGSARVEIVDNSKSFQDVPADSWASGAVAFASSHELFNGTSASTFSPDTSMTRGMLAVVLHNLENNPASADLPNFPDVSSADYFAQAVTWAAQKGIVQGYADGTFGAGDSITREQLAVMLYRSVGSPAVSSSAAGRFSDAASISAYAQDALNWAVENGILNGMGNNVLNPQGNATRAQVAQMMKNFVEAMV